LGHQSNRLAGIQGERLLKMIHDGIFNEKPSEKYIELNAEETEIVRTTGKFEEKCFLWVLDEISIKIIREKTPNVLRTHKKNMVCHTNITGCSNAHLGGELFFCHTGDVYISYFSDRYGNPSNEQWEEAKKYIENLGYSPLKDILETMAEQ